MEKEIWKPILGYEGIYEVSNLGNIRSINRVFTYKGKNQSGEYVITRMFKGKTLKPNILKDGYAQVILQKPQSKGSYFKVHRLVANAFLPNPENKPQVNHKNGIRNDNRVQNLEWVTVSENHKHAFKELGKAPTKYWTGKPSINRKLTDKQIKAIKEDKRPQTQIANDYNVCQQTISNIKTNKTYTV